MNNPWTEEGCAFFTPPGTCPRAKRPAARPRLPRLWICDTHQRRQCAACAAVARGVKHCCSRGHPGYPHRPPRRNRTARQGASGESTHPRGGGASTKGAEHNDSSSSSSGRLRPLGGGPSRGGVRPPSPGQAGMHGAAQRGTAWTCRDGGSLNPHTPKVLAQARPPAETRVGATQDTCMSGCMLLEVPRATMGALDPYGPPSILLFFPPPPHTHRNRKNTSESTRKAVGENSSGAAGQSFRSVEVG